MEKPTTIAEIISARGGRGTRTPKVHIVKKLEKVLESECLW